VLVSVLGTIVAVFTETLVVFGYVEISLLVGAGSESTEKP
jgi:hypothetical protein